MVKCEIDRNAKLTGGECALGWGLVAWAVGAIYLATLCGGCAYKGGKVIDGTNLEVGICVPGTDLTINALSYTSGIKVAGNTATTICVTNEVNETNSYFGVITMERKTRMSATIAPVEVSEVDVTTNVCDEPLAAKSCNCATNSPSRACACARSSNN